MKRIILLFLLSFALVQAEEKPVYNYTKNPDVSEAVWDAVKPYLLPSNHPVKKKLDKIFTASRVTAHERSVKAAGFTSPYHRPQSRMVVSRHKDLPGYLVKMFTDDQRSVADYTLMLHRIKGARSIQRSIEKHGYEHLFKVPKKWIYPLPAEPVPLIAKYRKNFIIVVEDANILPRKDNYRKWKSSAMSRERMKALYVVMKEQGLKDSVFPFNLPFSEDGKIAFIDTEYHHSWPVHFNRLTSYFPSNQRNFWKQMIYEKESK